MRQKEGKQNSLERDTDDEKPYRNEHNVPIAFNSAGKHLNGTGFSGHTNKQEFAYGGGGEE